MVDDVEQVVKRCTLLMAQEQVFISHACCRLGLWRLSGNWLSASLDNMNKLELLNVKGITKAVVHDMVSLDKSTESHQNGNASSFLFLLYKDGGCAATFESCSDKLRLFVHLGLGALTKKHTTNALLMFQKAEQCYDPSTPPCCYDELLHANNAHIISLIEKKQMNEAVQTMQRRLDIVSKKAGSTSAELAHELHRFACLHSVLGHHEKCVLRVEESMKIVGHGSHGALGCFNIKLLATTHDAMLNTGNAMRQYLTAISKEEDITMKAGLMNAISHLLILGGKSQQATDYLDKSMSILQNGENSGVRDEDSLTPSILFDTMMLYGDIAAQNRSFSEAIDWYESALSSFETIQKEVDKNAAPYLSGTGATLTAIGNICFETNNFADAIKRYTHFLSLKNECLLPCQRAGTLCNLASAYFKMDQYEKAEKNLDEALIVSKSLDETFSDLKATIMCNLGYILYRRERYIRAHDLFSEGKNDSTSRVVNTFGAIFR